ncbi:MAG: hypothetical protein U9Q95_04500, partial [Candidatus Eisenbacteria bacterium]|nr:hypothetical protein [Candidatus Eisenbacteria bacterium]
MQRVLTTRSGCGVLLAVVFVSAATLCAPAPDALAASASFWKTDSFAAAEEGRLDGVSILRDGRIVLSHELERLDIPEAQYVWAGEGTGGGVVVAIVGTPGEVLRLGGGDPVTLLSLETADLPAMAVSPAGDIFVGTAPGGEVHVITPDGESRLFFETGEGYIWSMAFSPDHGLLVGTGDDAKVYAVDNDGTGVVIYESDDASVSAL